MPARLNSILAAGALALVLALSASASGAPNFARNSGDSYARSRPTDSAAALKSAFVKRSGTRLTHRGVPYRFVGINVYMAASGGKCGGKLYPNVGVPLSHIPRGSVIRFWAFQNFFVSGGRFDWKNLDRVLGIAAAHRDKVIPVLANQHHYCDGAVKDLAWYQNGYRADVAPGDILPYEQYVSAILKRYAGNSTIAMWQLTNEGEAVNPDGSCDEPSALDALTTFSNNVGGLAHELDPNHLVSLGVLAGYSGSGQQWCGAAGSDYRKLMATTGNDVCDFHDYGYPGSRLGRPFAPNLASAIRMCRADKRPVMVAETGIYARNNAQLERRSVEFRKKFEAQFQKGVVGELMWTWAVKPQYRRFESDSNYSLFPGDPSLDVLQSFVK
jgi:mannan endo-1,4-beta-mannosidase